MTVDFKSWTDRIVWRSFKRTETFLKFARRNSPFVKVHNLSNILSFAFQHVSKIQTFWEFIGLKFYLVWTLTSMAKIKLNHINLARKKNKYKKKTHQNRFYKRHWIFVDCSDFNLSRSKQIKIRCVLDWHLASTLRVGKDMNHKFMTKTNQDEKDQCFVWNQVGVCLI